MRGGGLGGGGGNVLPGFLALLPLWSPSRTVEFEDEDVNDSLTAARPWGSRLNESASLDVLPALLRVTGGRLYSGLCWRFLISGKPLPGLSRLGD